MEFIFEDVEALDKVPQDFRSLYTQGEDGKFTVAENFKSVAKAIVGLGGAAKAARAEAKAKNVDLSPLQEFGTSPTEIKAAIDARYKTLEERLAEKGNVNVEKIKQEFAAAHSKSLTELQTRNTALQNQLYTGIVERDAVSAITDPEVKGVAEFIMPLIRDSLKVLEKDGRIDIAVVDASGDRRFSGVTGQPMTIKELVLELKAQPKYGRLFDSTALEGGGKKPGSGVVHANVNGTLTSQQKIARGLQKRGQGR